MQKRGFRREVALLLHIDIYPLTNPLWIRYFQYPSIGDILMVFTSLMGACNAVGGGAGCHTRYQVISSDFSPRQILSSLWGLQVCIRLVLKGYSAALAWPPQVIVRPYTYSCHLHDTLYKYVECVAYPKWDWKTPSFILYPIFVVV